MSNISGVCVLGELIIRLQKLQLKRDDPFYMKGTSNNILLYIYIMCSLKLKHRHSLKSVSNTARVEPETSYLEQIPLSHLDNKCENRSTDLYFRKGLVFSLI